ncbi:MAG: sodium/solute symporter [Kiritimatiellae bacterium]|nr:sodium/solute symporter [Kiritimatiellia bacterium]MDD5520518.1 sodium/solute symporter [Kiritimatiellia bacterium]
MNLMITGLDLGIVVAYLVGVVALGCFAGMKRRSGGEGSHYFLADNTLTWPVIGLAMFAANISTVHLVSLSEAAYKYGLAYGNFEWMAGFTLILLSLFFAPLYLRSRVPTLPDFLERRFNRKCRDVLAVVSVFSALVIHIGVALYTAAWVLRGILGIDPHATIMGIDALMFFIIVVGVLTGIYTMIGGLLAVVWTESVQAVLLLIGAVCITAVGYIKIGGWSELAHTLASNPHPLTAVAGSKVDWGCANFLSILRNADDPSGLPWYAILLGYPVIGIWYWCCDQTIVQRVLAAKDERHARIGPLFCSFIKILPVFFFVLPGVICVALVQKNMFNGQAPQAAADCYTFMITHMLPIGLKGLVTAAMLAAAMQTCSAALNSTATLVAYDMFKRWRPETSDHRLVKIGKVTTVIGTVVAIISSPMFGHYNTIFEGLSRLICYVAPPITTVFLFGVFWHKASGTAAYITMITGGILGAVIFFLDWFKDTTGWNVNFMMMSFYLLVICSIVVVVFSYLYPEKLKPEAEPLVWKDWREPLRGEAHGHALGNYRILSGVVFVVFLILYAIFH